MSKNSNGGSAGISMAGLLQVTFIVLKLCKVIGWSWWWVLAPTWASLLLVVIIVAAAIWINK